MKTIILNGSPKGNVNNSGSYFLAKAFVSKMENPCEIHSIAKENQQDLYNYIEQFDNIIIITPNYVHSVPGVVLDFLHKFPSATCNKSIGFIIQSGYPETSESEIICRYFKKTAERLGYHHLGTIAKGECAGIAIMPNMFKKLAEQFAELGKTFEQTNSFDKKYIDLFSQPYLLPKGIVVFLNLLNTIGIGKLGWIKMIKKNNAYQQRLDMPFLDQPR